MEHNMRWQDYIHTDQQVLVGKPIIKGTRLSVDFILGLFSEGWVEKTILDNYPQLSHQAIQAVFAFSAEVIRDEELYPINNNVA
jgi:uncharacterized protein (DUF433 family)